MFDYVEHKPLASVDEDFYEVGKQAALLFFQKINEENEHRNDNIKNVEIPCKLVIHT